MYAPSPEQYITTEDYHLEPTATVQEQQLPNADVIKPTVITT